MHLQHKNDPNASPRDANAHTTTQTQTTGSQLKDNQAAQSLKCHVCLATFICTTTVEKLKEHQENKHPKSDMAVRCVLCACCEGERVLVCVASIAVQVAWTRRARAATSETRRRLSSATATRRRHS